MKKVIFVCIVSLAVCFVVGNSIPGPAQQSTTPPPPAKVPKTEATTPKASVPDTHDATTTIHTLPTTTASPAHATTEANVTTEAKPDNQNTTKATPTSTNTTTQAPTKSSTTPAAGKKNDTVPVTTPKAEGSTKAAEPEPKLARGFDGPSFIGGIILTLGLLAIGFMGFKYYKNQTERNYHTL